jgi:hypothetical protein
MAEKTVATRSQQSMTPEQRRDPKPGAICNAAGGHLRDPGRIGRQGGFTGSGQR